MRNIFKKKPQNKENLVNEAIAVYSLFSLLTNKFVLLAGAGLGFMVFSGGEGSDKFGRVKNIFCTSSEFAKDASKSVKRCLLSNGGVDSLNVDTSKISCIMSDAKIVYEKNYNDICGIKNNPQTPEDQKQDNLSNNQE